MTSDGKERTGLRQGSVTRSAIFMELSMDTMGKSELTGMVSFQPDYTFLKGATHAGYLPFIPSSLNNEKMVLLKQGVVNPVNKNPLV
jgi:hypothetical protein